MTDPITCEFCLQPLTPTEVAWLPYCEYQDIVCLCDRCYLLHVQKAEDHAHDARRRRRDPE